jgi:hypothetical protein
MIYVTHWKGYGELRVRAKTNAIQGKRHRVLVERVQISEARKLRARLGLQILAGLSGVVLVDVVEMDCHYGDV